MFRGRTESRLSANINLCIVNMAMISQTILLDNLHKRQHILNGVGPNTDP